MHASTRFDLFLWKLKVYSVRLHKSGPLLFREKKNKISRDFQGQIRREISQFCGIFAGKKSKFAEKSADFPGF